MGDACGDLTGAALRSYVEKLKDISDQIDSAESVVKSLNQEYEKLSQILISHLQTTGQKTVAFPGLLKVTEVTDFYFGQPQSDDDVQNFNAWIEAEGLNSLRKVNSQTLNAELNRRRRAAEDAGELFIPPPGIDIPTTRHKLRVNKA